MVGLYPLINPLVKLPRIEWWVGGVVERPLMQKYSPLKRWQLIRYDQDGLWWQRGSKF